MTYKVIFISHDRAAQYAHRILPVLTLDPNEPPVSQLTRGDGKLMAHSTKNLLIIILASTTAFLIYQFWLLTN